MKQYSNPIEWGGRCVRTLSKNSQVVDIIDAETREHIDKLYLGSHVVYLAPDGFYHVDAVVESDKQKVSE